ncbi:lipoprotein [Neisseria animaloris]|uniref:Lipoprotein n=1 Tax=Neisseria animaloris TaxID=326522 RepID=A0A1X3CIJ5_9NEIS|nr:surface-adhesin E family protein [Neisseria animaloris]OSI07362.1 hypothetical protein BWD08_07375 [Neisseria animaloris]VEH87744.1 lipoprotein [Neisseria animaloris]VEJ22160.1 lipoprotein [Neisseria animaloris]
MNISLILRRTAAAALVSSIAACTAMDDMGDMGGKGPNVSGHWDKIGTTSNGNIKAFIDRNSIQKNGNLVTFRDKKTVQKPNEERYVNTPRYKTAIGTWEMHCVNKTYRLTELQLIDEKGMLLVNETYTAAGLRPLSVMSGSITEKQFEAVCDKKL